MTSFFNKSPAICVDCFPVSVSLEKELKSVVKQFNCRHLLDINDFSLSHPYLILQQKNFSNSLSFLNLYKTFHFHAHISLVCVICT